MKFWQPKMATLRTTFLVSAHLLLCLSLALSMAPDKPIKCLSETHNCTVTNWLGSFPDRSICRAGEAAYPATEAELIAVVAKAAGSSRKMRVATRHSHSVPKLVCPDGDDGLLISTKNLNRIVNVDRSAMTLTVESGVTLKELIKAAADVGLALPHSPYWSGVTVGGMLSTGAHGSSLWGKGGAVHDYVVEIRIVSPGAPEDGYVKVRNVNANSHDFDAVKVSLGVLGVISQVTLQLEPIFKRSVTLEAKDDHNLVDQVEGFGDLHEFGDFVWFPSQKKVLYRIDNRVPSSSPGNGRYDQLGFRPMPIEMLEQVTAIEENFELAQDQKGKCEVAKMVSSTLQYTAFGLTNDGTSFTGYPVIGYQNDIQSYSGCLDGPEGFVCPWDRRVKGKLFHLTSISISLSDAKSFYDDLKKLFDLVPESACGIELNTGLLMRYVKATSAYLGKQEDSIEFDLTYYRSRDPMAPRLHEDILEEVEQMAVFKYGGLPHWGKNRNVAFEGVIKKYKNAGRFLEVKEKYDPKGLFSSRWTDQMLGLQGGLAIIQEGCALEGLCICSEDNHCAPKKGYLCRPGKTYKEARVCTHINSHNEHIEL